MHQLRMHPSQYPEFPRKYSTILLSTIALLWTLPGCFLDFPGSTPRKSGTQGQTTQPAGQPAAGQPAGGGGGRSAAPLDSNSRIRLDRANQALARIQIRSDLRSNVPYSRAMEVSKARDEAVRAVNDAIDNLRMIRDRQHPEVQAFRNKLRGYEEYARDLTAVMKGHQQRAGANRGVRAEFFRAVRWLHKTVSWTYDLLDNPKLSRYIEVKDLRKTREAFAKIRALCTGRFKALANDPMGTINDNTMRPATICRAAARGDALLRQNVVNRFRQAVRKIQKGFEDALADLPTSNGSVKKADWTYVYNRKAIQARLSKRFQDALALVGAPAPSVLWADVDRAMKALLAAIPQHARKWRFPGAGYKMFNDQYARKQYKRAYRGARIFKTGCDQGRGWKVVLNALRLPKYRYRQCRIYYKVPRERWCRYDSYTVYQDAKSRRRFGKTYMQIYPSWKYPGGVVRCP